MKIVSKFVIGSDEGVSDFLNVKKLSYINLYKNLIDEEEMNKHFEEHFDERKIITDLNDLSNQLIIAYKEDLPVAYCFIKSGSRYSVFPEEKRATEIDFAILPEHDSEEIRTSLYNKFLSATKFTDIIWINILENDILNEFFKSKGFIFIENSSDNKFNLPINILSLELLK